MTNEEVFDIYHKNNILFNIYIKHLIIYVRYLEEIENIKSIFKTGIFHYLKLLNNKEYITIRIARLQAMTAIALELITLSGKAIQMQSLEEIDVPRNIKKIDLGEDNV